MSQTAQASASASASASSDLQLPSFPLVDLSRTPSPYSRSSRSAAQSEDDDDDDDDYFDQIDSSRPLVSTSGGNGEGGWRGALGWLRMIRHSGLGRFFFRTWAGWQIYIGLLVFWVGGCGVGLVLMNRFVMLSGVYKFPYPLTATLMQLILTHILLIFVSALTRAFASPLQRIGLGSMVAPSLPAVPMGNFRTPPTRTKNPALAFLRWLSNGTGGIAGGGIFEFDKKTARQVLPLSLIFLGKVALSNIVFAYSMQSFFTLSRIGIIPLALFLTHFLSGTIHSANTLSACITATCNLLAASVKRSFHVTWEAIVSGLFSSIFVALYPIILLRTQRLLLHNLSPQSNSGAAGRPSSSDANTPSLLANLDSDDVNTEFHDRALVSATDRTRAHYQLLHYTSLLTIICLTPLVLLSGDVGQIMHNCYFLDVPWFWFLTICGGIGSTAVFATTPLLVSATSPLSAVMVSAPKAAMLLVFLERKSLGVGGKIGVALCVLASAWYAWVRRQEMSQMPR